MPSYLISPPAVQRVAPTSKPIGTPLSHVSVSAVHGSTGKPLVVATKQAFTPASSAPIYLVSQPGTYLRR